MKTPTEDKSKTFCVVVRKIYWSSINNKIPTTFLSLAPENILFLGECADVLVGVFHIMWDDMPRRRTYRIALQELVTRSGAYLGTRLRCGSSNDDLLTGPN